MSSPDSSSKTLADETRNPGTLTPDSYSHCDLDSVEPCLQNDVNICKKSLAESSSKNVVNIKRNPRIITLSSLPPCNICGSVASGLHYGVVSCEACKSFFKRSFSTRRKYKCRRKQHGECKISKYKKCPFCRLQRCHDVGMSRGAIKVGRYTPAQRKLNIVQMRYHKHGVSERRWSSSTPESPGNSVAHHPITSTTVPISHKQHIVKPFPSKTIKAKSLSVMDEQSALIKAIVHANEKHNPMFSILKDDKALFDRQLHHYSKCRLKDDVISPFKAPSWQEFDRFYNVTGMEMDNRVFEVSLTTQQMDAMAKTAIKFAKAIPGFRDLPLKDQASLVKGGFFEFWQVCSYRGVNTELQVVISNDGDVYSINDASWPGERKYLNRMIEYAGRLQGLRITKEEDALIQAVILTFPDRATLEQADLVEKLHWDIVWSLWTIVHQNHQRPSRKFCEIIDRLIGLRELAEFDNEFNRTLPFDIPELHSSKLICEMSDCYCIKH